MSSKNALPSPDTDIDFERSLLNRRQALCLITGTSLALACAPALARASRAKRAWADEDEEQVVAGIESMADSWRYFNGMAIAYPDTDSGRSASSLATLATSYPYSTWEASYGTSCFGIVSQEEVVLEEETTTQIVTTLVDVDGVARVGIDVSKWQGGIDWDAVAADGVSFAIVRCGWGSNYESQDDSYFLENVEGAQAAGLSLGIYLYSYATQTAGDDNSAASEAKHVLRLLDEAGLEPSDLDLPIFLDMEDSSQSKLGASALGRIAATFCGRIAAAGYKVGVYASKYWWTTYLTDDVFTESGMYRWAARYPTSTNSNSSDVDSACAWQFTSHGSVGGIDTNVDVDFDYVGKGGYANTWSWIFTELAGDTRYETMREIVLEAYRDDTSAEAVVATGENYPDALAAASLAGVLDAPIVLVGKTSASIEIAVEVLDELEASHIYVMGGTSAVSSSVVDKLKSGAGVSADRLYGDSRQETAVAIANKTLSLTGSSSSTTAIVAAGANYPDALSASPYAYWSGSPIYLAEIDGTLSSATLSAIKSGDFSRAVIIGGVDVVSSSAETSLQKIFGSSKVSRLYGDDRYETSEAVAEWSVGQGMSYDNCAIATGENYPDALAGATLCGRRGSVILLANGATVAALSDLSSNASSINAVYYLGGTAAVSETSREAVEDAIR